MTEQFVIATAGHVDHGKSALVRALTGTTTDRWETERQRGLTIDLGFAHLLLPSGRSVSFVDVPGHERFVGNMLAGLGPTPIVCLVVAADAGWQAQTTEHRDAIKALGIDTGIIVISRIDLAPDTVDIVSAEIREQLAGTGLADAPIVAASAVDGTGLDEFRRVLDTVLDDVAPADSSQPMRFWVDRAFAIKGAGTVVTGTLSAGTLQLNDELELTGSRSRRVSVRNLQSHDQAAQQLTPVTRAAINLRGVTVEDVSRGDVLVTADAWFSTAVVDVAGTDEVDFTTMAQQFSVHIGTATVYAHCRPLGPNFARLTLDRTLPLHIGDRFVLRGTGQHLITGGATVLDVDPPALRRRGAAKKRAETLAALSASNHLAVEVRRRGAMKTTTVSAMGIPVTDPLPDSILLHEHWFIDRQSLADWAAQLQETVAQQYAADPSSGGITEQAGVRALALTDRDLLSLVVEQAALLQHGGKIFDPNFKPSLGSAETAVAQLEARFATEPFNAPTADELADLGLGDKELAAAAQQQRLLRLPGNIVLGPKTPALAMRHIAQLPQPFAAADARRALDTTRRTLIPLLEHLDARGWTQRVDGSLRKITGR